MDDLTKQWNRPHKEIMGKTAERLVVYSGQTVDEVCSPLENLARSFDHDRSMWCYLDAILGQSIIHTVEVTLCSLVCCVLAAVAMGSRFFAQGRAPGAPDI